MSLFYVKRTLSGAAKAMTTILGLLVVVTAIQANAKRITEQEPHNEEDVITVTYCELLNTPDKFKGKLIRVKAILVAAVGPVLHRIDSYFYHADCRFEILTDYGFVDPPTSKIGIKLKKCFLSSNKGGQGKAEVVLVGRFQIAPKDGFGSFSSFRYKIELSRIESVKKVSKRTP